MCNLHSSFLSNVTIVCSRTPAISMVTSLGVSKIGAGGGGGGGGGGKKKNSKNFCHVFIENQNFSNFFFFFSLIFETSSDYGYVLYTIHTDFVYYIRKDCYCKWKCMCIIRKNRVLYSFGIGNQLKSFANNQLVGWQYGCHVKIVKYMYI